MSLPYDIKVFQLRLDSKIVTTSMEMTVATDESGTEISLDKTALERIKK